MFDGEQLQQLIGSTTTRTPAAATLPLPFVSPPNFLPPPGHHHVPNSFTCFDSIQPHFLYPAALAHHRQSHQPRKVDHEPKQHHGGALVGMNMEVGAAEQMDASPWSSEEVVALFRIRSSFDNWFPDFTWEHVSRKLADLGYKRSADKCKEKFELESRCFDNNASSNNYRIFSDLDELCHGDSPDNNYDDQQKHIPPAGYNKLINKPTEKPISTEDRDNIMGQDLEQDSQNNIAGTADALMSGDGDEDKIESTKRKRMEEEEEEDRSEKKKMDKKKQKEADKLEMLKGLCDKMVKKLMAQQEEMHNKLIQDMVRRDEEKVKREEAWKEQELERMNKELEARTKEQQIAGDRQTTLLNFLSKLAASTTDPTGNNPPSTASSSSSSLAVAQNPSPITPIIAHQKVDHHDPDPTSSSNIYSPQVRKNPQTNTLTTPSSKPHKNPNTDKQREDHGGKRWPRDEVLSLINIRCTLSNSSDLQDQNNGNKDNNGAKAPLWERISQGMSELGYKRSAKRCKEKWENINKYFRKTKDSSKKRSVDSRTCPYFHQLSTLYNQGKLSPPENHSDQPAADVHVSEGEKNVAHQAAGFDFELDQ